jgi:hypothetical protein
LERTYDCEGANVDWPRLAMGFAVELKNDILYRVDDTDQKNGLKNFEYVARLYIDRNAVL